MSKRIWSSLVLAISLAAPGCRMCCPSYDYCGPLDPAESNSECCGMSRRGSAFNGYTEGEVIVPDGAIEHEHEQAPAAPPEPVKKQAMIQQASQTQARPIPAPQRSQATEARLLPPVQKSSSRRTS